MTLDTSRNTPLHVACENLEVDPNDPRAFASIINLLTLACGQAYTAQNSNGENPLSLLLSSLAMRRRVQTGDLVGKDEEQQDANHDTIETLAGPTRKYNSPSKAFFAGFTTSPFSSANR